MQVQVEQREGSITLTVAGGEPRTYNVKDGHVTVAAADVPAFLAAVPGSSVSRTDEKKLT